MTKFQRVLVDYQERLLLVVHEGEAGLVNALRLAQITPKERRI